MTRRGLSLLLGGLLMVGLLVAGWLLPVPYVTLGPGPVFDTLGRVPGTNEPVVSVTGHRTYPTNGRLDAVTVLVSYDPQHEPTLFQALSAWLDSTQAVVPAELLYPPGQSTSSVNRQNTQEMQQSGQSAITAALRYLHVPVTVQVVVGAVTPRTPAAGRLQPGDQLLAVDGHPVTDQDSLRRLISSRRPGATVRLTIRRAGQTRTVVVGTVPAVPGSTRAIVGILVDSRHAFPFSIHVGLTDVGGPSAGLMFALGIIDRLTPRSLTAGRTIAGTGTIDDAGTVGPIGGIQQKVVAAHRAGATVFLAPADECASGKAVAPAGLRVVPVHTLGEAVSILRALAAGSPVPSC